jgi:hypothetical protein
VPGLGAFQALCGFVILLGKKDMPTGTDPETLTEMKAKVLRAGGRTRT